MSVGGASTGPEKLGILIKETQSVLHQRMGEALRPLGLTVSQYACLQTLHDEPGITSSELARRAFVSRQSMNVLLRGLVRRELVQRSDDPGPRRELAAVLTPPALILVADARDRVQGVVERMTAPLDDGRIEELREALGMCHEALTTPEA